MIHCGFLTISKFWLFFRKTHCNMEIYTISKDWLVNRWQCCLLYEYMMAYILLCEYHGYLWHGNMGIFRSIQNSSSACSPSVYHWQNVTYSKCSTNRNAQGLYIYKASGYYQRVLVSNNFTRSAAGRVLGRCALNKAEFAKREHLESASSNTEKRWTWRDLSSILNYGALKTVSR